MRCCFPKTFHACTHLSLYNSAEVHSVDDAAEHSVLVVVIGAGIACNQSESSILVMWYKWTNQKAGFSHSILMT